MNVERMLSREEFVEIMDRLRAAKELADELSEVLERGREKVEYGIEGCGCIQITHETDVIRLLERIMRDEDAFISYFVYELDYGKNYVPGLVTDGCGEVDLGDAGALYDYGACAQRECPGEKIIFP